MTSVVFQLSVFLQIREEQVLPQLICTEFFKSNKHNCDEVQDMIPGIAQARGIKAADVEGLLIREAWDNMIAARLLRKWPISEREYAPEKKKPGSVKTSTVSKVTKT